MGKPYSSYGRSCIIECTAIAYAVMAYVVMAYVVMAYILVNRTQVRTTVSSSVLPQQYAPGPIDKYYELSSGGASAPTSADMTLRSVGAQHCWH